MTRRVFAFSPENVEETGGPDDVRRARIARESTEGPCSEGESDLLNLQGVLGLAIAN
jgi:hypothetical protein